jgi:hypothetical protein
MNNNPFSVANKRTMPKISKCTKGIENKRFEVNILFCLLKRDG